MCEYVHRSIGVHEVHKSVRSPNAEVTGGCNPPDVDAGNPTWVLCNSGPPLGCCAILIFNPLNLYTHTY